MPQKAPQVALAAANLAKVDPVQSAVAMPCCNTCSYVELNIDNLYIFVTQPLCDVGIHGNVKPFQNYGNFEVVPRTKPAPCPQANTPILYYEGWTMGTQRREVTFSSFKSQQHKLPLAICSFASVLQCF